MTDDEIERLNRRFGIFETYAGWVGIESSAKGLARLVLPRKTPREAARLLGIPDKKGEIPVPEGLQDVTERLQGYFNGQMVFFPDKLDLTGATEFQRKIWGAARLIPYGETRSYTWIAMHAGNSRAARAAGNALGKNPLPVIIPCHRVLESCGRLGGFSGGLDVKRYLLQLESPAKISRDF